MSYLASSPEQEDIKINHSLKHLVVKRVEILSFIVRLEKNSSCGEMR